MCPKPYKRCCTGPSVSEPIILDIDISRFVLHGLVDLEPPESDRVTAQRVSEARVAVQSSETHGSDVHEPLVADVEGV